jgi:hypothetical protein
MLASIPTRVAARVLRPVVTLMFGGCTTRNTGESLRPTTLPSASYPRRRGNLRYFTALRATVRGGAQVVTAGGAEAQGTPLTAALVEKAQGETRRRNAQRKKNHGPVADRPNRHVQARMPLIAHTGPLAGCRCRPDDRPYFVAPTAGISPRSVLD